MPAKVTHDGEITPEDYKKGYFVRDKFTAVLVNNTTKSELKTVPAGKRWFIVGGWIHNADDVARNCQVNLQDSANVIIGYLKPDGSLNAGDKQQFPKPGETSQYAFAEAEYPLVAKAGEIVEFKWTAGGASAGGTATNFLSYYETEAQ